MLGSWAQNPTKRPKSIAGAGVFQMRTPASGARLIRCLPSFASTTSNENGNKREMKDLCAIIHSCPENLEIPIISSPKDHEPQLSSQPSYHRTPTRNSNASPKRMMIWHTLPQISNRISQRLNYYGNMIINDAKNMYVPMGTCIRKSAVTFA